MKDSKKTKPTRLSKGFWHQFVPHTDKLFSPQNIKIEIWDLSCKKIINRWHPQVFCVRNCAFDKLGTRFVLQGGCSASENYLTVYHTESLEQIKQFHIPEHTTNAIFNLQEDTLFFASWEGNLYKLPLATDLKLDKSTQLIDNQKFTDFFIDKENDILLLHETDTMFLVLDSDGKERIFIVRCSTGNSPRYGIVSYHITEKTTEILNFSTENIEKISCIKYFEGKLAILTTQYEGKKDDETSFSVANLYIYDLKTHKNTCIKANFEVKSIFSDAEALCCHSSGKLAVIGLNEIFVLDTQNEYATTEISAHYPTSVVFSDCGNLIAIGGEKAVLVQLTVSD